MTRNAEQVSDLHLGQHRLRLCRYGAPGAPALVLVHGGCAHRHWWNHFATAMAERFHVVTYDLRGHGDSDAWTPAAYTLAHHEADLVALLAHLGIDKTLLVGHSLGALIAGHFAINAPERVERLVLVDSNAQLSEANVRYLRRLQRFPQPTYSSLEVAIERFRLLPTATTADPQLLRSIARHSMKQLGPGAWTLKFDRATLGQLDEIDLIPDLRDLARRLCFLRGEHSVVLPERAVPALLTRLPGVRCLTVPKTHHHVMLDNPDGFLGVMRQVLP